MTSQYGRTREDNPSGNDACADGSPEVGQPRSVHETWNELEGHVRFRAEEPQGDARAH